jgi:nucleoside-diphosphate-sugar epimerase
MRVLVTGGSGFIGTYLLEQLLGKRVAAHSFDRRQSARFPEVTTVGDVRDADALDSAMRGVDAIVHLAAEHADNVDPASLYYDVNVGGAENLCRAAVRNEVRRIVFTSTVALYGLNVGTPTEDYPARPFNAYGNSKKEAERVLNCWAEGSTSRALTIIRPCVIFGASNRGNVYNFLQQVADARFLMVGSGENKKSLGFVRNIVDFIEFCLRFESGKRVFNYADKPDLTTSQLVGIASAAFGRAVPSPRIPFPVGLVGGYVLDALGRFTRRKYPVSAVRIRKFCADTTVSSEAMRRAGFEPRYSLEAGLQEMIRAEFPERTRDRESSPA